MATPHKDEQPTPVVVVGGDAGSFDPTAATALADIKTGIDQLNLDSPVLGQATKANSVPVAIASDQDKLGVNLYAQNAAPGDAILKAPASGANLGTVGPLAVTAYYWSPSVNNWVHQRAARDLGDNYGGDNMASFASHLYNATAASVSYDKFRNNHSMAVLGSAARTAAVQSADLVNHNAGAILVTIDITAVAVATTLTVTIKYKNLSGKYVTLLTSAALAGVGVYSLQVGRGLPDTTNLSANKVIPRNWRVEVTPSDANSVTYSIDTDYVL